MNPFDFDVSIPREDIDAIKREIADATPEQCADCPLQCHISNDLKEMLLARYTMLVVGEKMTGSDGERLDHMIDENVPAELASEMKQGVRTQTAMRIDEVESDILSAKTDMALHSSLCDGPLKMRASKAGTTYTVSACTSPELYSGGGTPWQHVPVHIKTTQNSL